MRPLRGHSEEYSWWSLRGGGEKEFSLRTKKLSEIEHKIDHYEWTIMNGAYGKQTRGDPMVRFGARGDPRVVNITWVDSVERELISSEITGRNDPYGRGMREKEKARKWEDGKMRMI